MLCERLLMIRKAERRAEQWGEFMDGMDDADLGATTSLRPVESRCE